MNTTNQFNKCQPTACNSSESMVRLQGNQTDEMFNEIHTEFIDDMNAALTPYLNHEYNEAISDTYPELMGDDYADKMMEGIIM